VKWSVAVKNNELILSINGIGYHFEQNYMDPYLKLVPVGKDPANESLEGIYFSAADECSA
jgi:hypothetical protein